MEIPGFGRREGKMISKNAPLIHNGDGLETIIGLRWGFVSHEIEAVQAIIYSYSSTGAIENSRSG